MCSVCISNVSNRVDSITLPLSPDSLLVVLQGQTGGFNRNWDVKICSYFLKKNVLGKPHYLYFQRTIFPFLCTYICRIQFSLIILQWHFLQLKVNFTLNSQSGFSLSRQFDSINIRSVGSVGGAGAPMNSKGCFLPFMFHLLNN